MRYITHNLEEELGKWEKKDTEEKRRRSRVGLCEFCWAHRPTKHVKFHQNIGMVVMRKYQSVEGNLCKNCINEIFWDFTLTTLVLGWWGAISFFVTPYYILNNIIYYIASITKQK